MLFAGAILTETIFSWPGVGKWLIEAIYRRDYPVLQGGVLLLGVVVMVREPARRPPLRPHQPAHPAHAMTAEVLEAPAVAAPTRHPAASAARVLALFLRQPRRGRRPRRHRRSWCWWRSSRRRDRAALARSHQYRERFLQPPFWQEGGSLDLSARHRRDRPRHPLAPDLRRAPLAARSASSSSRSRSSSASCSGLVAGFFRGCDRDR